MPGQRLGQSGASHPVDVSFAVACFNPGAYLEEAVRSALNQTGVNVEVIVVDDGSTDGSREKAARMAQDDPRIVFLTTPENRGPGGARNLALKAMHGRWFAVLDADDVLLPERSRTLIDLADGCKADAIADNPVEFGDGIIEAPMFQIAPAGRTATLGFNDYCRRSWLFGGQPSPGYLKPMIRADAIKTLDLGYNEALRIGEDDDFIVRALAGGMIYRVADYSGYRYRRHDASISHRLSLENLERMISAERDLAANLPPTLSETAAFRGRAAAFRTARAFTLSIEALKAGSYFEAVSTLARHPSAISLDSMPIGARLWRAKFNASRLSRG